jgi:hypothetical protein
MTFIGNRCAGCSPGEGGGENRTPSAAPEMGGQIRVIDGWLASHAWGKIPSTEY